MEQQYRLANGTVWMCAWWVLSFLCSMWFSFKLIKYWMKFWNFYWGNRNQFPVTADLDGTSLSHATCLRKAYDTNTVSRKSNLQLAYDYLLRCAVYVFTVYMSTSTGYYFLARLIIVDPNALFTLAFLDETSAYYQTWSADITDEVSSLCIRA